MYMYNRDKFMYRDSLLIRPFYGCLKLILIKGV